jgi:hypothetical protein
MNTPIFEIIGYIASLLVAISLMMSSILRLRIINLVGAMFFTIYGLLIQAYPIAIVNVFIVFIDIYYLVEIFNTKEYFKFLEMPATGTYLKFFLNFHREDILKHLPGYNFELRDGLLIFFVLRNLVPAGLFIGELQPEGLLKIQLDFVIPGYRDLKVGRYLYQQKEFFQSLGVKKMVSQAGSPKHAKYLTRMGFHSQSTQENSPIYELSL